jgi:MinD superfamily P-loop ATPase
MIREIAVMSGKGGAGKTSVTAALLKLLPDVVAVDGDVNASNLPILLTPRKLSQSDYFGMDVAQIDIESCTRCGHCKEICAFSAIAVDVQGNYSVNDECEGCAACAWVCPVKSISMVPHCSGTKYLSQLENGFLLHADLIPGEDNSGKLIASIRAQARKVATEKGLDIILIDGPPGTSCQAISSITGVDRVLAVLEESLSGLSDYQRLAKLLERFRIPHMVLLNKAGVDLELGKQIEVIVAENSGEIIGRIPFDMEIPRSLSRRETLLDISEYRPLMEQLCEKVLS